MNLFLWNQFAFCNILYSSLSSYLHIFLTQFLLAWWLTCILAIWIISPWEFWKCFYYVPYFSIFIQVMFLAPGEAGQLSLLHIWGGRGSGGGGECNNVLRSAFSRTISWYVATSSFSNFQDVTFWTGNSSESFVKKLSSMKWDDGVSLICPFQKGCFSAAPPQAP